MPGFKMRARSKYTPGTLPRVVSERKEILPVTNPRDVPASVYHDAVLPELPTPQRKGIIDEWFTLSTHILPAAFPRSGPDVPYPEGCDADGLVVSKVEGGPAAKEARVETGVKVRNALYEINRKHWLGELPGNSEKPFWACVNRFVRKVPLRSDQEGGRKQVTLLLAHGNGFGKECWEPALLHMLLNSRDDDPIIEEIWSWEAVNHGDSALINKQNLGAFYEWLDNSRDIINFLTYYLPNTIGYSGDELPTHLPLISQDISEARAQSGLTNRTLVGIGHSFGGCTLVHAARLSPKTFSALVLLDPVIAPPLIEPGMTWADGWGLVRPLTALLDGAIIRRNGWESKAEALHSFKKNSFFATWDPLSVELYVECQLWENKESGEAKLKMSGTWEGSVFAGHRGLFEAWDVLPLLDERVALKFIMPEAHLLDLESAPYLPFLRPKNCSHIVIVGTGHLLCHEAPQDTGDEIWSFLRKEYGSTWQGKL
ncbi:hypothetical protein BDM02DRAFT_609078 [Thelephora ganbajun]|uniref:Uncharacterized protein n=1 Tax=Thelephora ganbajun TaxID=370292 RepID=A0ACB6Z7Y4_THEGA|nr:hypothetical protein BDM02DRAFT_609078 [Thelephora ganbajun]